MYRSQLQAMEPIDDLVLFAEDFERGELYAGDVVWVDPDGNYIDKELVNDYFERYLRSIGAKQITLGENK